MKVMKILEKVHKISVFPFDREQFRKTEMLCDLNLRIVINGISDKNVTKHQFSLLKQPQFKSTLSHQEPNS